MDFFIDLENFLSKKKMSLRQTALICCFLLFALFSIVMGIADGNYCSIVAVIIMGFVCFLFSKEVNTLHERNRIITYQKSIAANGFDSLPFAFFVFSDSGKCIFVNRTAQNLFSGVKIRTIEDFIFCFGKYHKVVEAVHTLQVSAKNEKPSHIDIPMKFNSDALSCWRIAVSPVPGYKGFSGWTVADLTASVEKSDSLENDITFLSDIINCTGIGYMCLNEKDEIVFCNKTFAAWLKIEIDDIKDNEFSKYIIKEKSEKLPSVGNTGRFTDSLPAKVVLKAIDDGMVEVVVNQISQDSHGNKVYSLALGMQHEETLIQAIGKTKLYFEHIFEDAPIGIVVTDGAEVVRASNRTFKIIVDSKNLNSHSVLDYIMEEERETTRIKLYDMLSETHTSMRPFEIHFNSQREKTVMVYITKVDEAKCSKGNDGLVIYFIDITERKELQQQFVQSQKMQAVGQLAGGIAHDFNNLLTAMIGYCDLLLEKCTPADQSFDDIVQIKQNANRASNLVKQLLAFSRQQTLEPVVLNVNDMIGELSALLKRLLGVKIELKIIRAKDATFIKVDQIQFEQIIINLVVNARDAMKEGAVTVQISLCSQKEPKFLRGDTMPPGDYVTIEVIDTGCGIEEKYLNRIFDPFFSTKEKGHGTGLGLSTVYGIVNQTGGFISVESEIGAGTKFSLYFPMILPQEGDIRKESKLNTGKIVDTTGTGTILLVEDEDAVRTFSSRALRDKGYQVIEASNGEAALEFINKDGSSIDLIITDVVMPKMDGPTLMKCIRNNNKNMNVIFISGYTEDDIQESLKNNNNIHFLSKPFDLNELANKVKEVIG